MVTQNQEGQTEVKFDTSAAQLVRKLDPVLWIVCCKPSFRFRYYIGNNIVYIRNCKCQLILENTQGVINGGRGWEGGNLSFLFPLE